jgi:hypothetical protein
MDTYTRRIRKQVGNLDPWNNDNGLTWYREAHEYARSLSHEFNLSLERVAGIIAVLSPACRWEMNCIDARDVLEKREDATVTSYSANKRKALNILYAKYDWSIYKFIKGNKVKAFFDNILHPDTSTSVTLDRHILRAVCKPKLDKELNKIFASANSYQAIAERFRQEAKKLNIRPCQLQAAIWLQVRPSSKPISKY